MQFGDLSRSWTDALTTLSVGSFAVFLPMVTSTKPDGSLSIAFGQIPALFQFADKAGTTPSIIISLMILSILMAIGAFIIQFGEFIALLPDMKSGRQRIKKRIDYAAKNAAYMLMFANAYVGYRLMCGFGGLLVIFGLSQLLSAAQNASWQPAFFGFFVSSFGMMVLLRFARYSFTSVDWLITGEIHE